MTIEEYKAETAGIIKRGQEALEAIQAMTSDNTKIQNVIDRRVEETEMQIQDHLRDLTNAYIKTSS